MAAPVTRQPGRRRGATPASSAPTDPPSQGPRRRVIAVHCPHCARSGNAAVVLVVVDGPGVVFRQIRGELARPGEVSAKCRTCGRWWTARMLPA